MTFTCGVHQPNAKLEAWIACIALADTYSPASMAFRVSGVRRPHRIRARGEENILSGKACCVQPCPAA